MYKIYFNKDLIKDRPWTTFLTPILGIYKYKWKWTIWTEYLYYDEDQLQEWESNWKKLIEYSNINECDFCIRPRNFYIDSFPELKKEAQKAKEYKKKIIVFADTDLESPIPYIDNMIVFRTSLTNSSPKYEYSLPDFVKPLYMSIKKNNYDYSIWYVGYGWKSSFKLRLRDKIRNIKIFYKTINFIIFNETIHKLLKNLDRFCIEPHIKINSLTFQILQRQKWLIVRWKVVKNLENSNYKFNYIKRDIVLNPKVVWDLRKQYIDNINNSTFIMVARWHWNHAYRLYECMSVGKIPLFIDTNCRLPLEDRINYKDLFLWIPYKNINDIDKYINEYLHKHKNELDKIEDEIKNIYATNLRMYPFYQKILNWWYII